MIETGDVTRMMLIGDALACADCGQAVVSPDPATTVTLEMVRRNLVTHVQMAKCPACAERDRTAAEMAQLHLRHGVTVDGRQYTRRDTVELLIDARAAFDAAGIEPPAVVTAAPTAVLIAEIAKLSPAIGGLRWRDLLNAPPSIVAAPRRLVEPGTANCRPWAHLEERHRERLRALAGKVLRERVALLAPPAAIRPPVLQERQGFRGTHVPGGCLYCGIGKVTVSALVVARHGGVDAAARSLWKPRQVAPATIGARKASPVHLLGWLCPACERAAAAAGSASSARAMEIALSTFLGVSGRSLSGDELWVTGLRGWGALVADALRRGQAAPPPNDEPWGHLSPSKLLELARDLRRGG